ncbi:uncharacterized protein LOC116603355 [Nematostella vectensis]|uniref:uncharacterized protein LOC116603355 n=1 Tax=Nematostella vectensis TaxID=45351 RepID=UPI00138FAC4A|nr:uncharacterized protein LOC116603355 [Nematostella vectensis]XP_048581909.1 uncharacterized protein LOC116603355 [Nematostella vectensis]
MMGYLRFIQAALFVTCAVGVDILDKDKSEHAQKKTIELQTAYVYRKASQRLPHYSVILGSSGKSVLGPAVPAPGGDEIHRVQGFLLNNDEIRLGDTSSFSNAAISITNRLRMLHHAPPLAWSEKLAKQARKLAYKMARERSSIAKRTMAEKESHSTFRIIKFPSVPEAGEKRSTDTQNSKRTSIAAVRKSYEESVDTLGENVERLFSVSYGCDSSAAFDVINKWHDQSKKYSYSYPHVDEKVSSFTQLVWKNTKIFGAGCALRRGLLTNDVFVVALYSPPGNSDGGVTSNVLKPGDETRKPDVYSNIFR